MAPVSPVTAGLLPTALQDEVLFLGFSLLAGRFLQEAAEGRHREPGIPGRDRLGRVVAHASGAAST